MNISILTEGGKNIGMGHMTRCLSICQAFKDQGVNPVFFINADRNTERILKGDKNYKFYNWVRSKDRITKICKNADAVIVDSYLADINFYKEISECVKVPVYIDDYRRIRYPRGVIVNGCIFGENINYPDSKNNIYLLGTQYAPLRKEFWSVPDKDIQKDIKNLLITFGGIDRPKLIQDLSGFLKDKCKLDNISCIRNNIPPNGVVKLMLESDLCISGGGQTTYELARCGVPFVGVSFAKNQELNLQGWQTAGLIKFAGNYQSKSLFEKIYEIISGLTYKERIHMSKVGKKYVDGNGAQRIARKIIQLLNEK
ncbi:MAG: UDP-2,4-diacetamido-2,4,6-trideoxy-beta-L-altropyranose hydrolase [Candidatus Parcubacteria bacterium]|nr:UDP-2,4-diacetamido-2,4,6-trideoxy-beta-L-altropyranose hydrolase [Candidatus Parcubacteria bacterium]